MDNYVRVLDPAELQVWLLAIGAFYAASYLAIWLVTVVLSRFAILSNSRPSVSLYFGWSVPLSLHTILCAFIVVWSAKYYRDLDISLGYCSAFFAPMLFSGLLAIKSIRKLQERLRQAESAELTTK
ncbi:MAG: hypothetical protein KZQ96_19770 [Candidatus Thiodiazotropha sp. (ex Lucinoma borealis)]|nr:hypothetical protein [Candidatus Thiodiazotropha sp. (ex Lucinoma borealis)]